MNDNTKDGYDPFTQEDAAYVMGALSQEDRRAYEAHLVGCPACTKSVDELSGLTDLLDKVPLARVLDPALEAESPPGYPLLRLVGAARAQRRRRAVWGAVSGAVAASLVALAIVVGVARTQPAPPGGINVAMSAVRPTGVSATLQLSPTEWGTKVSLDCRWAAVTTGTQPAGPRVFRLVAVPRDGGAPQNLAQWSVAPGEEAKVVGSTNLPADRIATVELQAVADDSVLLRGQPDA
jgi:Putative zinc-finger